jgi:hypothetical protein
MTHKLGSKPATLTLEEIERRLDSITASVVTEFQAAARGGNGQPSWIRPAELVRRMRPYLVLN